MSDQLNFLFFHFGKKFPIDKKVIPNQKTYLRNNGFSKEIEGLRDLKADPHVTINKNPLMGT